MMILALERAFLFQFHPGIALTGNFTLNTSGLSPGIHNLYVRGKTASGQVRGFTHRQSIYVEELVNNEELADEGVIVSAEYFIDDDPGVGAGIPVSVSSGDTVTGNFTLNTSGLSPGSHNLYGRGKTASGQWGFTHRQSIFVEEPVNNEEPADDVNCVCVSISVRR
jgi:hypothetical protein